jgi:hypothetical protein
VPCGLDQDHEALTDSLDAYGGANLSLLIRIR